jgi:hypothetical protein
MSDADADRLFQAFADATRRDIVRRVTVAVSRDVPYGLTQERRE